MNDPKRSGWHANKHPNSLESRSAGDPVLRKKISTGRYLERQRQQAMEYWHATGNLSVPRGLSN